MSEIRLVHAIEEVSDDTQHSQCRRNSHRSSPRFPIQFFVKEKEHRKQSQLRKAADGKGGNHGSHQDSVTHPGFPNLIPVHIIIVQIQAQQNKELVNTRFPENAEIAVPVFPCHRIGKTKMIEVPLIGVVENTGMNFSRLSKLSETIGRHDGIESQCAENHNIILGNTPTIGKIGKKNRNFVTTDEFEKILNQLYVNGYVLVDMDSFIAETVTGETITYSSKSLYLPDGKKPFMMTETMVNYFNYMIDGNADGVPDKDGAGFASKLVLRNGEIKAEMVNSVGETVVGNYDLVPILEDFIEAHPDFSYQGARALLAVTGHEGVFGYRTNKSVIDTKGQAYYDSEVAAAKEVAAALKSAGYEFASFTYKNEKYGDLDATTIRKDITNWTAEVLPILGSCDTLVFAKTSDISANGDYSNCKFNVLYDAGFRYFISHASKPSCKIAGNYVRQLRVMVTGTQMAHASTTYAAYFDSQAVLNDLRGNVPQ